MIDTASQKISRKAPNRPSFSELLESKNAAPTGILPVDSFEPQNVDIQYEMGRINIFQGLHNGDAASVSFGASIVESKDPELAKAARRDAALLNSKKILDKVNEQQHAILSLMR